MHRKSAVPKSTKNAFKNDSIRSLNSFLAVTAGFISVVNDSNETFSNVEEDSLHKANLFESCVRNLVVQKTRKS